MSVIFIVLPLAIFVVLIAVAAYMWSARSGQFDDLDTPAVRMLHDDDGPRLYAADTFSAVRSKAIAAADEGSLTTMGIPASPPTST